MEGEFNFPTLFKKDQQLNKKKNKFFSTESKKQHLNLKRKREPVKEKDQLFVGSYSPVVFSLNNL